MKSRMFAFATALLCATVAPGAVFGQVLMLEDFEGPLPGTYTGFPGGWSFWGDGDEAAELTVTQEITDQVAFDGVQSYKIDLDSSAINSWYYFGMGGFLGFWGADFGAGGGQPGADNPANYVVSFDIDISGVASGDEVVGGNVSLYKADYEAVFGVDLNNDGDMEDGYSYWSSDYSTNMGAAEGWVHVEWNLASGSPPTVPDTDGVAYFTTPVFDDETTFQYGLFPFNSPGGFGLDADNVVLIDNFQFEFIPPVVGPGDFDEDGDVDGGDFLAWQRGNSPTPLSADDLAAWQANFGGGG
ncbi:MAG: hypothetical protein KDA44_06970, partial [Planctomycetales bacterium]|nr:hypothetical protein [Planctomycetales bacterium]